MKKIKLILPMLAFIAAVFGSFALKADRPLNEETWYINSLGQRTDQVVGEPQCAQSQANCAQKFQIVNGDYLPVGDPIKGTRY